MRELSRPLSNRRLYLADLAGRLEAMESGAVAMNAVAYRLVARRMTAAMAGYPEPLLAAQLGSAHTAVTQALEQRHFEVHGALKGEAGQQARQLAQRLFHSLTRRRRRR